MCVLMEAGRLLSETLNNCLERQYTAQVHDWVLWGYTLQNTLMYMHTSTYRQQRKEVAEFVIKVQLEKVIQTSSPHGGDVISGIIFSN